MPIIVAKIENSPEEQIIRKGKWIGWLSAMLSATTMFLSVLVLQHRVALTEETSRNLELNQSSPDLENNLLKATIKLATTAYGLSVIGLITACLLLLGSHKRKGKLIIPWLVFNALMIIYSVYVVFFFGYYWCVRDIAMVLLLLGVFVIFIGLYINIFKSICNLYIFLESQEILSEGAVRTSQIENDPIDGVRQQMGQTTLPACMFNCSTMPDLAYIGLSQ